jgi:hypothetical protein
MKNGQLKFMNRDTRDHSSSAAAQRRYQRVKGKTLKHILLDRFLNQYGYDKGAVTAQAIVEDLLGIIEHYYRFTDNSFLKQGQMVWPAVPIDEYPAKGKSMAQTRLKPVVLDIICDEDIEALRTPIYYRDMRMKKIERWTNQAYDQGALLSQLDLAMLLGVKEQTAGIYTREYRSLYGRPLPTRGNIQQIGGGQTHKQEIIGLYLEGYLVPTISQKTKHSKEAVERYIRDFEAIRMLNSKFDDRETISLITRLSQRVVNQYVDLIPVEA